MYYQLPKHYARSCWVLSPWFYLHSSSPLGLQKTMNPTGRRAGECTWVVPQSQYSYKVMIVCIKTLLSWHFPLAGLVYPNDHLLKCKKTEESNPDNHPELLITVRWGGGGGGGLMRDLLSLRTQDRAVQTTADCCSFYINTNTNLPVCQ